MKKILTKEEALSAMAGLCARSEQCESDIYKKLRAKGLSNSDTSEIIERLKEMRFVDNSRYASAFARDKVRFSSWGKMKIRMALVAKRIPSELIDDALESIDPEDYAEAARRSAASKISSLDINQHDDRIRFFRYMMSRGFESDIVNREIKRLKNDSQSPR